MVMDKLERTLGLPKLSEIGRTLEKFPDDKQLRQIKEVLVIAERVSHISPDLDKVIELIREANSLSPERLRELLKVLRSIERIMKNAPADLVGFLASLKEE